MPADAHEDQAQQPILFGWNREELITLLIGVGLLAVLGIGYALFGFAGLIIPSLLMVFAMFVAIVLISLG